MIVGLLTIDLAIFEAQSLKDKRRLILSLKQKLSNRFNVSVAEVAYQDSPKRCRMGVALVGTETRGVHAQLDKLVESVRRAAGLTLLNYEREML